LLATEISFYEDKCGYIDGNTTETAYFIAENVSEEELEYLLSAGYRRFGGFFFNNICPHCRKCRPIRVLTDEFVPSKSQRRNINKNRDIEVAFIPLEFKDEIFEIYKEHSLFRFGKDERSLDDFVETFYNLKNPGYQSEYYIDGKLAGVGFLDKSSSGLSSIYFIYKKDTLKYGLGTFSVIKEIELAKNLGLKYYYLGYYIEENSFMNYKINFKPNEFF